MAKIFFSQEFTVNQVSFITKTDTFVNVQKRKELVQYRSASNAENVNLSFIQSEDINSSINLTIDDRSTSLIENRLLTDLDDQILQDVTGFSIERDTFFVTDVFTENLATQGKIPLFFKHELSRKLEDDETYNDLKILDQEFKPIVLSQYLNDISTTSGLVYSNLENTFDPITGLSELFFISYTVKKQNSVLERYTEILNNVPVFHPAELSDLDPDTGELQYGIKAYIIQEDVGQNFNVTLPLVGDYGLRRSSTARIEVVAPPPTNSDNPWFVSVKSGQFLSTGVTGIHKYYIAEFNSQFFFPFFPYKQTDETSYRVSRRVIKTQKNQIAFSHADLLYPEILVSDKDGVPRFAITADPDRVGVAAFSTDILFSNALLGSSKVGGVSINSTSDPISGSSIDSAGGFIVLPAGYEINETDIIRSTYTYSEVNYEFTLFNFNPLNSVDLLNQRIALLLRPQNLGETLTKTLYYLVVNEDGLVLETDIDFIPAGLSTDIQNTVTSGLLWYGRDPSTVTWAEPGGIDLVDSLTVEGENPTEDILILGDVYTRNAISPNNLVLNDIRLRGGGIQEIEVENSIVLNSDVEHYWDIGIWDGKPFPGAASIFVDIPVGVVTTAGGDLTPENITEIVNRHIGLGIYPVIHGYNVYEPTVTGLLFVEPTIYTLQWTPGPTDSTYDVYEYTASGVILVVSGLINEEYTAADIETKVLLVAGRPEDTSVSYLGGSIYDIKSFIV